VWGGSGGSPGGVGGRERRCRRGGGAPWGGQCNGDPPAALAACGSSRSLDFARRVLGLQWRRLAPPAQHGGHLDTGGGTSHVDTGGATSHVETTGGAVVDTGGVSRVDTGGSASVDTGGGARGAPGGGATGGRRRFHGRRG